MAPRTATFALTATAESLKRYRRAGVAATLLLLGGCAAGSQQGISGPDTGRLMTAGLLDVSEMYIESVAVEDLTVAGLAGLSSLDPNLEFHRDGGRLLIRRDGLSQASLQVPADPGDARTWGDLAADAIVRSRNASLALNGEVPEDIYEAVFDAMVAELDDFSRYSSREEASENRASRDGFGGIGVTISLVEGGVKVLSVMEGTPADDSGLDDGDLVTKIDGIEAASLDQREVVHSLRGPLRTRVALEVRREGEPNALYISVIRAHIVPQTVSFRRDGSIGILRITGFNQRTAATLYQKVLQAQNEMGRDLRGFVLDLRDNPGGLLDQSVEVADLFLSDGEIVSTHGRHPDSHQYFSAVHGDVTDGLPIVVLINGNSASAAEIVAAALQDAGRAIVVGSNSYGKGTVQNVMSLPNDGELTLTWARFHAPSGYSLNDRGVLPDICTTGVASHPVDGTLDYRQLTLIGALERTKPIAPEDSDQIESLRARCPRLNDSREGDLELAVELLTNPEFVARQLGLDREFVRRVGGDRPARLAEAG